MLSCGAVPLKAGKVLHQLTYRGTSIILVEINLPGGTTNQKHYPDIWVVTRHQYGISALVCQTSFGAEASGSVAKCRLFSQATTYKAVFNRVQTCYGTCNAKGGKGCNR